MLINQCAHSWLLILSSLPRYGDDEFSIVDELLIQAFDKFGQNDAVTEKDLEGI